LHLEKKEHNQKDSSIFRPKNLFFEEEKKLKFSEFQKKKRSNLRISKNDPQLG
jgi:hypothetical protein